ncbi:MAG: hypothetical protein AAFX87_04750 [Bacteroidota bacterium]
MGLDLWHYKLGEHLGTGCEYFLKEEVQCYLKTGFVPDFHYRHHKIQSFWEHVAIFETKEELIASSEYLDSQNDGYTDYKLRLTREKYFLDEIADFEQRNQLEEFQKSFEKHSISVRGEEIQFESILYEGSLTKEVVYLEEVGHQGTGMKSSFFNYFINDSFYMDWNSFLKLGEFIDGADYMKVENIQTNFIENYEEGVSMMFMSW